MTLEMTIRSQEISEDVVALSLQAENLHASFIIQTMGGIVQKLTETILKNLNEVPEFAIKMAIMETIAEALSKAKAENIDELGSEDGINLMRQNLEKLYKKGDK